jgi:hypothetical protein
MLGIVFTRYADDIVGHGYTKRPAPDLKVKLTQRLRQCGLTIHPDKTKIVYCQSWKNKANHEQVSFDFLGFSFRPRLIKRTNGQLLTGFLPAISQKAAKRIPTEINSWPWVIWLQKPITDMARFAPAKLLGWLNYFALLARNRVQQVLLHFDKRLNLWAKRKFHSLKTWAQAVRWNLAFRQKHRGLFPHWR